MNVCLFACPHQNLAVTFNDVARQFLWVELSSSENVRQVMRTDHFTASSRSNSSEADFSEARLEESQRYGSQNHIQKAHRREECIHSLSLNSGDYKLMEEDTLL